MCGPRSPIIAEPLTRDPSRTETGHSMTPIDILIMAAGQGTRMKSRRPKVLQRLAGRPLLLHVLDQALHLQARSVIVITGHGAAEVRAASAQAIHAGSHLDLGFVRQEQQLGTGHAVQQTLPQLRDDGTVLVLSGDVPLTRADTLRALVALVAAGHGGQGGQLALLTVTLPDPAGYGRIVRSVSGAVQGIVEHQDASEAQRAITEVYGGIMAVPAPLLRGWLARLGPHDAQGEIYLTDIVAMAAADGVPVVAHHISDTVQVAGVNTPVQLAELERAYQLRQARALMEQGLRLADPARFDLRDDARSGVRGELLCGQDVEIDVNCIFTGRVELGEGVQIGAHCCIANARIAAGAVIHPYTHIDGEQPGATVGEGALVGPFARLRPGAQLGRRVHVGNFVEVKNSRLADGAKANHLAYLGDATVGERVNYGAGSITANYDGANKHRTVIEADAHIGSNCVLVAPVTIGAGGTVGAGSTITKSTAAGALSVVRGKQISLADWVRPTRQAKP
ncbi:glucosamine-1-phosphate N-acetyltransferase / UDP-N-acetylglucosamine pyrophosphorylase [Verminephrobacter eiseniae EF01-2]|uniref:Bifunctional protein GlmU n=2 Tax=Verminephrobacter eiseniae TaxID=364317 RepID=A1WI07_VEREI|nr:glucosamine-1-phosphate N-acetyltransferase / UDP-N-acetylglucosamine pyrophosphorylase [Verminephrobacter eiseniae EF01-2]